MSTADDIYNAGVSAAQDSYDQALEAADGTLFNAVLNARDAYDTVLSQANAAFKAKGR